MSCELTVSVLSTRVSSSNNFLHLPRSFSFQTSIPLPDIHEKHLGASRYTSSGKTHRLVTGPCVSIVKTHVKLSVCACWLTRPPCQTRKVMSSEPVKMKLLSGENWTVFTGARCPNSVWISVPGTNSPAPGIILYSLPVASFETEARNLPSLENAHCKTPSWWEAENAHDVR